MPLFGLNLPTASGNTLSGLTTKLQESTSKVVVSFGGVGPFKKVAASEDAAIQDGAADAQRLLSDLRKTNADPETSAEIAAARAATLQGSMRLNAVTVAHAQDLVAATEPVGTAAAQNQAASGEQVEHRVVLSEIGSSNEVVFRIMPEISESRTVKYDAIAPPQSPGAFQKYTGTDSVQWSVNATLTCRTTEEATENLRIINQLRAWTMPYFGENTRIDYPDKIGAPPPVLRFSAYRNQMVGPVPVIITSLNWPFTQDVDYIPAYELGGGGSLIPFPTVIKVAIQLVETFSTDQFNGFNLTEFRLGNFEAAWGSLPGQGANDRAGTRAQGGLSAPEAAQVVLPNSLRGGNGFVPQPNGGRSGQNGLTAAQLAVFQNQVANSSARDVVRGQRGYGITITERTFTSGGGGDFGGGGASGDF